MLLLKVKGKVAIKEESDATKTPIFENGVLGIRKGLIEILVAVGRFKLNFCSRYEVM